METDATSVHKKVANLVAMDGGRIDGDPVGFLLLLLLFLPSSDVN